MCEKCKNKRLTYIVTETEPEKLQETLCSLGSEGWILCNILERYEIQPGLTMNGQPKVKTIYQLVMKTDMI